MSEAAIPPQALALHTAILGKTGSGKTSTAKLAVEQSGRLAFDHRHPAENAARARGDRRLGIGGAPGMKAATNEVFAFDVWLAKRPEWRRTINARTRGQAKRSYHVDLIDAWPGIPFTALRCRKIGAPHTSAAFRRNAAYRNLIGLETGQHVNVGEARGFIVGHNDSANFDVLFDIDSPRYAGMTLNVHPGEMEIVRQPTGGQG